MSLKAGVGVEIEKVERLGEYCLSMTFSDGHVSTVDIGPFLRGSQNPETRRFLEAKRFRNYSLLHGNLVWGDFEMCFPVEDLYEGRISRDNPGRQVMAVAESRAEYGVVRKSRGKGKTRPPRGSG